MKYRSNSKNLIVSFRLNPLIDLYSVSYMWYSPIAVLAVLIVGLIVSYLTHPLKPNEINPKLLINIGSVCCCCLPKRIREILRFGVNYDDYFEEKNVCNQFFSLLNIKIQFLFFYSYLMMKLGINQQIYTTKNPRIHFH